MHVNGLQRLKSQSSLQRELLSPSIGLFSLLPLHNDITMKHLHFYWPALQQIVHDRLRGETIPTHHYTVYRGWKEVLQHRQYEKQKELFEH